MKTKVIGASGYSGAFSAIYMSKRSYTPERADDIDETCNMVLDSAGMIKPDAPVEYLDKFNNYMRMLMRMSVNHITLGKFISFSVVVEGLHRGGQDDVDAHAMRFWNRIIRNSTRLATFDDGEMSDWYKGKIMPTDQMLKALQIEIPGEVTIDGVTWVKAPNGYIRKEYENNKDVRRGLYMLSIPSTFVFSSSLTEWGHIYTWFGLFGVYWYVCYLKST